ncbi:RRXRR domain-containing protein [Myxosarcina sp. GI1(2024)]
MTDKIRVPVLSPSGEPLMPTTSARARRWIAVGKAKPVWNDLKIFCVQLLQEPSETKTQKIVASIDPGKLWSGCACISQKAVLFTANLILPFKRVVARKQAQKILRRARRGRRINRNLPFEFRAHRQKRFDNRRGSKLPPSVRSNKLLELRIIKELTRIFPVSEIVYEYVKADVDLTSGRKKARSGKGFSPVMVGQKYMLQWLEEIAPTYKLEGWHTSIIRKQLGLPKNKDKSSQDVSAHANCAIAAAASRFMEYKSFYSVKNRGHHWVGSVELTNSPFKVISRPQLYRRQLHFENLSKGSIRKRKVGTVHASSYDRSRESLPLNVELINRDINLIDNLLASWYQHGVI